MIAIETEVLGDSGLGVMMEVVLASVKSPANYKKAGIKARGEKVLLDAIEITTD